MHCDSDECCNPRIFTSNEKNETYLLKTFPTTNISNFEGICMDNCIYYKVGDGVTGTEYCWSEKAQISGETECHIGRDFSPILNQNKVIEYVTEELAELTRNVLHYRIFYKHFRTFNLILSNCLSLNSIHSKVIQCKTHI